MAYMKTGRPSKQKYSLSSYFLLLSSFFFLTSCFLLLASLLASSPAHAALQPSLSIVTGYYYPRLYELNYILKYYNVELGPRNYEAKPLPYPVIYQGYSPADMPDMKPMAPKTGLQLQVEIDPHYAIFFGNSIAVFDSSKRDIQNFYVGFFIPSDRVTRFSLTLNQLWIGIKRSWVTGKAEDKQGGKPEDKSQKSEAGSKKLENNDKKEQSPSSRFYFEMGLLAITRAYLTTDVWLHVYAPEEGFDFYKVTETGSSGKGFATFLGLGGEYFINKWMSVGMDLDYTMGGVRKLKFDYYFTVDPLEKDIIKKGDVVFYTDIRKGQVGELFLDLTGLDVKGQVRFYF